jgi:hypothetical protein
MIIQKIKPLENVKTISTPIIPTSCHQSKRSKPRPAFPYTKISGREFFSGWGEGVITPHVMKSLNTSSIS